MQNFIIKNCMVFQSSSSINMNKWQIKITLYRNISVGLITTGK